MSSASLQSVPFAGMAKSRKLTVPGVLTLTTTTGSPVFVTVTVNTFLCVPLTRVYSTGIRKSWLDTPLS